MLPQVMDAKGPGFITPQKPILSASARKIKDNAADWHNLILKWESFNDTAFTTANKIVNLKISSQINEKTVVEGTFVDNENLDKKKEELERLCSELICILENMEKIQLKMEKLSLTLKGVCDLEDYHYKEDDAKPVHFHTWPTKAFYETSLKMSEMFKKEMMLKRTIVAEIAHTADQDLLLVYLSSWLYQPYIENNIKVLLESMLLETGHRPI
ncbi:cyclin-dependent kinase 2-interacting protein [Bombina bombina]|uniref:cyclin-dependent kinase 2-interacting protein n=1 Tax=Bombina bombina TaxID=8345 RepID=UPI00235AA605|nr:cyclin-dependent kinase 2-interacting protein [Bombina bombina]